MFFSKSSLVRMKYFMELKKKKTDLVLVSLDFTIIVLYYSNILCIS